MYRLLKRLDCLGLLSPLINKGVVSCTIVSRLDMYEAYLKYKKQGYNTGQSVTNVSIDVGVSEDTVYRAVKIMRC